MELNVVAAVGCLVLGALLGAGAMWAWLRGQQGVDQGRMLRAEAEVGLLRERVVELHEQASSDRETALQLAPLRATLARVEQGVRDLERERAEQFGLVGERLGEVSAQAEALRRQTASLSGALNASATRGAWGEVQLRRVLEHAGMLARCDFDEQVSAVSRHHARVRPDVVVRLPGDKQLVIDAKAPMGAFLRAQADHISPGEREAQLREHARAVRQHVEALAAKEYWSAFTASPELVVCFVPSDAVLAAALQADPALYDEAQRRKVVLASPATLLAMLRATAFAWQQDALTGNARELLALGTELHRRLATLGRHVAAMGGSLRRSVETYNQMVGTLENRVLVTTRRLHELGLADGDPGDGSLPRVSDAPRVLTAAELLDRELTEATPQREVLPLLPSDGGAEDHDQPAGAQRRRA